MAISMFLSKDHRACDDEFAVMENAISEDNWEVGTEKFAKFANDLYHHFDMEEKIMFETFEQRSGMVGGPTQMMRMEHAQMRKLIEELKIALDNKDKEAFLGSSDTLMFIMQQHNMKEEQMLYPMADQHISTDSPLVVDEMKSLSRNEIY